MSELVMTEETCCACGTQFQMQEQIREMRLRDGKAYFCPNGHAMVYTKATATQLGEAKEKLQELAQELEEHKQEITRLRCALLKATRESLLKKLAKVAQRIFT